MALTPAERAKRARDKKRGGPPRAPVACPSYSAYRRHGRRVAAGKPSDCTDPQGCADAAAAYLRGDTAD